MQIIFKNPYYLWTLLVIPISIVIHFISLKYSKKRALKFANFIALARVSERTGISSNYLILFIRIFVFITIILAISGTSLWYEGNRIKADYVIAIDSSASMLAEDLKPNRMDVAKKTAINFINELNYLYSSASIISFSGTSFVHQPLTKNKQSLEKTISDMDIRKIGGTDIGNAIITGSNILISSENPRIIILITDGRDNIGISYIDGIRYANDNNIIVHALGIGTSEGFAESADSLIGPLGIDEEQLKEIAGMTGGKYFNIMSEDDFQNAYREISTIEKRKISLDLTLILLILVLLLLVLEWVLINTRFRIIP